MDSFINEDGTKIKNMRGNIFLNEIKKTKLEKIWEETDLFRVSKL